jgi:UrcA family protein
MRDEMDARIWVEHHNDFSDSIDRAVEAVRASLRKLTSSIHSGGPKGRPANSGRQKMTAIDIKFVGLALAAALATSVATLSAFPASAQAATIVVKGAVPQTARVSHADLNLASTAGKHRLEARVRNAAEQLSTGSRRGCATPPSSFAFSAALMICRPTSTARAA